MHRFFKAPHTIDRLQRGPLSEHIESFVALLLQQGFSRTSARAQILMISRFGQWLQHNGIETNRVDEHTLQRFLRFRGRKASVRHGGAAALDRFLMLLRQRKAALPKPPPAPLGVREEIIVQFQRYLLQERCLSQAAFVNYSPFVDRFLSERFKDGPVNLSRLRATDVTDFVRRHARKLGPKQAQLMVSSLRSFFRHLQHKGKISMNLAECVPTVPGWSFSALPKFLPAGTAQLVLRCCDRGTPAGRRDYAILLLLARLGLRACEIVRLNLEDLDWGAGHITICGKGGHPVRMPLPADVGGALATYLRNDRPRCSIRRVFLRNKAPIRGFANSIAICSLVMRALKKAGVNSARTGAHLFRHTLATDLLRQGSSWEEIGELLRHRSPNTTAIYAKVDLVALHTLALPWPGGGR